MAQDATTYRMALKTKINTSITLDKMIHKEATKLATLERRNFSSYVEHVLWLKIKEARDMEAAEKASRRGK
jgi:hypothetical protein